MAKKIGLWNPYLDTIGGGEKHMLQICDFFIRHGYELTIFWDKNIQRQLEQKLSLKLPENTKWQRSLKSAGWTDKHRLLRSLDILLYATDGSYFYSPAKHTIGFCMVPEEKLYKMNFLNKIKTYKWSFISNSRFTQKNLYKYGVRSQVVYPILSLPSKRVEKTVSQGTQLTFLSVGRFFRHLHSKRHDVAVAWFVNFIEENKQFSQSKLILAGGLKKEDAQYFESLKKLASQYHNIDFRPNITSSDLEKAYTSANFYLHFAGWQVNETSHPERTEHLGITPLEAMSYGCITMCYRSGGIKEIVRDGENGYTFGQLPELTNKIITTSKDTAKQLEIRRNAIDTVTTLFSQKSFDENMKNLYRKFI
jgi:glycosyltransferase involved in cell wall biosynthesis